VTALEIKLTEMQENRTLKKFYSMPLCTYFRATDKYPKFERSVYNSFLCIAQHIAVNFFSL